MWKNCCTFALSKKYTSMKRLSLLFLVLSYFSYNALCSSENLINTYVHEIEKSATYISRHQARIDSLCAITPSSQEIQLKIAQEYQHFQSDSARVWYTQLQDAEEPIRTQAFIGLIQLLSASGHYANAFALLRHTDAPSINSVEGYKTVWLLYNEAATTSLLPSYGMEEWQTLAQQYYDSLLIALEKDTVNPIESHLWREEYRAIDSHDWTTALDYNQLLMQRYKPDQHQYAILAYGHAMIYERAGNMEKRKEWLIRSAITDVLCGITDNGSSWLIAQECYDSGDLTHAHIISDYTLTNASLFNAPTRYVQTYAIGHTINNKYEKRLRHYYLILSIALTMLAVILVVFIWVIIYTYRQNKKLSKLNTQLRYTNRMLKDANHVKEQYICRYLEVYSDYIRRLTTLARKSGEKDPTAFMNREMENFYRSFDDTFLSLYGSFVQDFNALLKPEARLTPKAGERMTVEMRIFALILLGINSSAKIAELLCYSPNTISNYRVKMKNSALGDRESFEQDVCRIGTIY